MHLALPNCCISSVDLGLSSYGLAQVKALTAVFYIFRPSPKCSLLPLPSWGLLSSSSPSPLSEMAAYRVSLLLSAYPGDTRISPWCSEMHAAQWHSRHRWALQIPARSEIPTWAICWRKIGVGCRWEKKKTQRDKLLQFMARSLSRKSETVNGGFPWRGVRKYGWGNSALLCTSASARNGSLP